MSNPVLCLSSGGDSFSLKLSDNHVFREVNFQTDDVHPYLERATECKTHQAVLEFLNGLTGDEQCIYTHEHKRKYPSHFINIGFGLTKVPTHGCSPQKMIKFIKLRIKEKNSLHRYFDKIGKVIGRTFDYLAMGTAVPIFGIIPGAVRVIIGAGQIIVGLALSIIFAMPAYCFLSENAQIIVQRSIKHVGYGPLNICIGILLGIPVIGTLCYMTSRVGK